jgi:hypothetical protein
VKLLPPDLNLGENAVGVVKQHAMRGDWMVVFPQPHAIDKIVFREGADLIVVQSAPENPEEPAPENLEEPDPENPEEPVPRES